MRLFFLFKLVDTYYVVVCWINCSSQKKICRAAGERDALSEESEIQVGGAFQRTYDKTEKTAGETYRHKTAGFYWYIRIIWLTNEPFFFVFQRELFELQNRLSSISMSFSNENISSQSISDLSKFGLFWNTKYLKRKGCLTCQDRVARFEF